MPSWLLPTMGSSRHRCQHLKCYVKTMILILNKIVLHTPRLSSLASLKRKFHTGCPMQWKTKRWPRKWKVPISCGNCSRGVRWHMQAWEQLENWKSSGKGMGDQPCGHNLQGYCNNSWHQEQDILLSSWGWLQHFEGQELLLFNLDNHHLFHYSFLFGYMHNMLEGKYPMATSTSSTSSPSQSMECICLSIGHWHGTVLPIFSLCSMSRRCCLWWYYGWQS